MRYRLIGTIGGKGSHAHQFREGLRGLCVDARGHLLAAGDQGVKVFDPEGGLQRHWATKGSAHCVAVDSGGTVHVGEAGRIERFDAAGTLVGAWEDPERFGLVTAIDFHGDFVLVGDAWNRCIRRCDSTGRWLNNIGKDNRTRGFLIPNGRLEFAVDEDGVIHASNSAKHRVERYSLEGKLLGHFGRFGTRRPEDFPGCCNPTNLTLAPQDRIVVSEKAAPRVKVYNREGKMLGLIGPEHFDPNCKNMDVAVGDDGVIYVADTVRLHVCVFEPVDSGSGESPKDAATAGVEEG